MNTLSSPMCTSSYTPTKNCMHAECCIMARFVHQVTRTSCTVMCISMGIQVRGFWDSRSESALFDIRIFNPNAPSNHTPSCAANYRHHEKAKRNLYEEQIREVEHATFTPLVFTTSGGASPLTSTFLKHLASRLAEKRDMAYSTTIGWLRARLNFSLLRSAVMCI